MSDFLNGIEKVLRGVYGRRATIDRLNARSNHLHDETGYFLISGSESANMNGTDYNLKDTRGNVNFDKYVYWPHNGWPMVFRKNR